MRLQYILHILVSVIGIFVACEFRTGKNAVLPIACEGIFGGLSYRCLIIRPDLLYSRRFYNTLFKSYIDRNYKSPISKIRLIGYVLLCTNIILI